MDQCRNTMFCDPKKVLREDKDSVHKSEIFLNVTQNINVNIIAFYLKVMKFYNLIFTAINFKK